MNKLTAEVARQDLNHLKSWVETCGISMKEERYMQALEIALPVLEQQESAVDVALIREVFMRNGFTIKDGQTDLKSYVYDAAFDLLRAVGCTAKPQSSTNPQIDNDGWIEWEGGECPVSGCVKVEYRLRAGAKGTEPAKLLQWEHECERHDIIAYRVVEQERERGEEE